jgi:hypothetical protein
MPEVPVEGEASFRDEVLANPRGEGQAGLPLASLATACYAVSRTPAPEPEVIP